MDGLEEEEDDDGPGSASDITPVASRCATPLIRKAREAAKQAIATAANGTNGGRNNDVVTLELGRIDRGYSHSDPLLVQQVAAQGVAQGENVV